MPYSKESLKTLYDLTAEQVDQGISSAGLSLEQAQYSDEEIEHRFKPVVAKMFPQAFQDAQSNGQHKGKKSGRGKKPSNAINSMELLRIASEQVGGTISFTEAGKILKVCGLVDQDQYLDEEAQHFLQACDLLKKQGKTYEQVAAHFGVDYTSQNSQFANTAERTEIIQELTTALRGLGSAQAVRIIKAMPYLAIEQLREVKAALTHETFKRLHEMMASGEIDAEIQQVWDRELASSGNGFGLLAQVEAGSQNQNILPGSSISSSTSD